MTETTERIFEIGSISFSAIGQNGKFPCLLLGISSDGHHEKISIGLFDLNYPDKLRELFKELVKIIEYGVDKHPSRNLVDFSDNKDAFPFWLRCSVPTGSKAVTLKLEDITIKEFICRKSIPTLLQEQGAGQSQRSQG
jgi:hypothetical protein